MENIEKDLQAELDKDLPGNRLKVALPRADVPRIVTVSVAEQLLGVAESIKGIHREIDLLQEEFIRRCDDLRKKLGSKG